MIETPQIVTTTPVLYAGLRMEFPAAEIMTRMGPAVQQVSAVLAAQANPPVGPWFTHHFHRPLVTFDMEIGFPVATPIEPADGVLPEVWPAMRVARTIFHGNYSGLVGAWQEFQAWATAQGIATKERFWEVYVVSPHQKPNPEDWQTELNWELAD